jgi:2-polyprenyl-3-methyl-5-hydroxy-6-metoxy-1,4-benzoquinol methylase
VTLGDNPPIRQPHKHAEIESRTREFIDHEASKPFGWSPVYFIEWAVIESMLETLRIPRGSTILDIGCGSGWTSLFLAEAGYEVIGYELVPANVELARRRAERWGSSAQFEVADMEALPQGEPADAVLLFQALHHTAGQEAALRSIARRLRPGGWLMLSEPTWLHRFSPEARATTRDLGWMERGLTFRGLHRDLRAAGFDHVRRWFQPTRPYEDRRRGFAWQLIRLIGANMWVAPQAHLWLAARRSP